MNERLKQFHDDVTVAYENGLCRPERGTYLRMRDTVPCGCPQGVGYLLNGGECRYDSYYSIENIVTKVVETYGLNADEIDGIVGGFDNHARDVESLLSSYTHLSEGYKEAFRVGRALSMRFIDNVSQEE